MDDIKFMTGYNVDPVVASESALRVAIDRYYGSTHAIELKKVMEDLAEPADTSLEVLDEEEERHRSLTAESEEAPVVKLVNIISPTRSRRAPRTSTSGRTRRSTGSATGSTASSTR